MIEELASFGFTAVFVTIGVIIVALLALVVIAGGLSVIGAAIAAICFVPKAYLPVIAVVAGVAFVGGILEDRIEKIVG